MADAPIGNKGFISDLDIRIYLRDTDPVANTLLLDLEFSQEELRTAWTMAVDKWNETPPTVSLFDIYTFPWRYHLILQVASNLLWIAANRYRRNNLQYQIEGGAVNDQDKASPYEAAAERLAARFDSWMATKKIELNVSMGFGWI